MIKKNLLYFRDINLDNSNYKELSKFFAIKSINRLSDIKLIPNNEKKKFFCIYCDPKFFYSKKILENFQKLEFLISSTTGTSFIDKKYCKSKKIKIISLENDSKFLSKITPTAEHTFGLLLMLIRNYIPALNAVNKGKFNRRPFGGYSMLSRLTLGIIGMGRLGKIVKKIAIGFSMKVVDCDKKSKNFRYKLKKICKECDIISLHIPAEKNMNFFSKNNFKKIKKPFFLINTSRGEIVEEKYIIKLLKNKKILGYATDVIKGEFSEKFKLNKSLIYQNRKKYNIVITPHIGGSTIDAWKETECRVIKKLIKNI